MNETVTFTGLEFQQEFENPFSYLILTMRFVKLILVKENGKHAIRKIPKFLTEIFSRVQVDSHNQSYSWRFLHCPLDVYI